MEKRQASIITSRARRRVDRAQDRACVHARPKPEVRSGDRHLHRLVGPNAKPDAQTTVLHVRPYSGGVQPDGERVRDGVTPNGIGTRSEEHTSELQSQSNLVCRLLLEKKKTK